MVWWQRMRGGVSDTVATQRMNAYSFTIEQETGSWLIVICRKAVYNKNR